jgi:hypothetical protein
MILKFRWLNLKNMSKTSREVFSLFIGVELLAGLGRSHASDSLYWIWAGKLVMGWNSWDCFATTVTEAQTRAQADV